MRIGLTTVALLCLTLAVLANPAAPEFGGTWDANGTADATYTQQTAILEINDGISVNVTNTTIYVTGAYTWFDHTQGGTLNNYGTIDMTGWSGRFVQIRNNKTFVVTNHGTFAFADGSPGHYDFGCTLNFYNAGTMAKTTGSGTFSFVKNNGTFNFYNYYVDGSGITNGGTIRADIGTFSLGSVNWFFAGTQAIDVAANAILDVDDITGRLFGGTWNGTGDGRVLLFGGSVVDLDNTFTINIDNGDRNSYTNGGVKLDGSNFRGIGGGDTLINKGKFWFTANGRWQGVGGINLFNQGWLVWDTGTSLEVWDAGPELRNQSGGTIDALTGSDDSSTRYNLTVTLEDGSTFRGKPGVGNKATWQYCLNRIDIKDGATVEAVTGELEFNPRNNATYMYFEGDNTAISTMNFNLTVHNGATQDIRNIAGSGITTVGSGATLHMKGSGEFLNDATDVLESKLTTVNGTFLISENFALTPGGGTLTINAGGAFGGTGALNGNLNCAGTNLVDVSGASSDTVTVNGTVTLSGPLSVTESSPATVDVYTLILNDGVDAVSGTYSGLPEGAGVTLAGKPYNISYAGGTGNDVTLEFSPAGSMILFR